MICNNNNNNKSWTNNKYNKNNFKLIAIMRTLIIIKKRAKIKYTKNKSRNFYRKIISI